MKGPNVGWQDPESSIIRCVHSLSNCITFYVKGNTQTKLYSKGIDRQHLQGGQILFHNTVQYKI